MLSIYTEPLLKFLCVYMGIIFVMYAYMYILHMHAHIFQRNKNIVHVVS